LRVTSAMFNSLLSCLWVIPAASNIISKLWVIMLVILQPTVGLLRLFPLKSLEAQPFRHWGAIRPGTEGTRLEKEHSIKNWHCPPYRHG
jgi:hypothetical protein